MIELRPRTPASLAVADGSGDHAVSCKTYLTGRTGGILKAASRLRRESARADRRGRKGTADGAAEPTEPAPAEDAALPAGDDDDSFDGA